MATSAAQPPVLLLHGMATSAARTWGDNGWLELLRDAKRPALALDLMGHGDAPKPHDPAAYEALEQAVVDALPDEPVDAIGFSLGARTILAIAGRHPERFRKIVTGGVGRNLFEVDKERAASIQRGINGQPDDEDPSSQYFSQLADSPEVDREALIALMHRKSSWPVNRETLKVVTQPVLVCIGDGDWAGPGDLLVEALPNATLKVLRPPTTTRRPRTSTSSTPHWAGSTPPPDATPLTPLPTPLAGAPTPGRPGAALGPSQRQTRSPDGGPGEVKRERPVGGRRRPPRPSRRRRRPRAAAGAAPARGRRPAGRGDRGGDGHLVGRRDAQQLAQAVLVAVAGARR